MKRLLYMLLGMFVLLSAGVLFFSGGVYVLNEQAKQEELFVPPSGWAMNDKCEDGHVCFVFIKYNKDGSIKDTQCLNENAQAKGFVRTDERCGRAKEKKATSTPRPPVITYTERPPTQTPFRPTDRPKEATATKVSEDKNDAATATQPVNYVVTITYTPTPFVAVVSNLDDCPEVDNCICLLVTEAYIQNQLDEERNKLLIIQNDILLRGLYLQQTVSAP